jgi:hypothetical protein
MATNGPERIQFGTGYVYFVPLVGGNPATPSSPRLPGSIQDFTFDNSGTIKELRSNQQYPDDVATSDKKASFKIGSGRFDIDLFNNLFAGEVQSTGGSILQVQEAWTIPASSPYTVTVTNSAGYQKTLAVNFTDNGQPVQQVSISPSTGEFLVSAGVYTFAAADAGRPVAISYAWTTANGEIVTVQNHLQGWSPTFEIYVAETYQELTANVPNYLHIYAARANKFSLPFKRADYLICDIEGECYANASGKVYDLYTD